MGEDVEMMHLVVSGMNTFCSMVDLDGACGAYHEDSPFVGSYRVIIFFTACMGGRGSYCISFLMYLVRFIL